MPKTDHWGPMWLLSIDLELQSKPTSGRLESKALNPEPPTSKAWQHEVKEQVSTLLSMPKTGPEQRYVLSIAPAASQPQFQRYFRL